MVLSAFLFELAFGTKKIINLLFPEVKKLKSLKAYTDFNFGKAGPLGQFGMHRQTHYKLREK
jgi:hypothetical protein